MPTTPEVSQDILLAVPRVAADSILVYGLPSAKRDQVRCVVCQKKIRTRITKIAMVDVLIRTGIVVDTENRCCREHFDGNVLSSDAVLRVEAVSNTTKLTADQIRIWMTAIRSLHQQRQLPIDFDAVDYTEDVYDMLLGVKKHEFQTLIGYCSSKIRNSSNRSVRNCLAIFLMKLRLGISQKVIAFLFGIRDQPVVHRAISAVREALLETFVPQYHGFNHISRESLLQEHSRLFFNKVLGIDTQKLVVILDGTYLYTQKPTNIYLQKKTYSSHKYRNLFKPMITCMPDGYCVEATGLYFADKSNNDANILEDMLKNGCEGIMGKLEEGDAMLLDRGFKTAVPTLESKGIVTFMPVFLEKGQDQFTTEQANLTRQVHNTLP